MLGERGLQSSTLTVRTGNTYLSLMVISSGVLKSPLLGVQPRLNDRRNITLLHTAITVYIKRLVSLGMPNMWYWVLSDVLKHLTELSDEWGEKRNTPLSLRINTFIRENCQQFLKTFRLRTVFSVTCYRETLSVLTTFCWFHFQSLLRVPLLYHSSVTHSVSSSLQCFPTVSSYVMSYQYDARIFNLMKAGRYMKKKKKKK